MPIKLNIPNPKSRDDLRREYVEKQKSTTAHLEAVLRKLIDPNRIKYQEHVAAFLKQDVVHFLEHRKPGHTIEMYARERYESHWFRVIDFITPPIEALTNYKETVKKAAWDSVKGTYSDFEVKLKRNADEIAFELAGPRVEDIVQTFLYRAKDKLVDVMLAYPRYSAKLLSGGNFMVGAFEGKIAIEFDRPDRSTTSKTVTSRFVIQIGLKYNRSKLGTPYTQYPLLFSDYVEVTDRVDGVSRSLNKDKLEEFFEFDEWVPPKQRSVEFRTIRVGSVIRTTDDKIRLVLRTKKNAKTKLAEAVVFGIDGKKHVELIVPAAEIAAGIAEIRPNHGYDYRERSGDSERFETDKAFVYFGKGLQSLRMDLGIPGKERGPMSYDAQNREVMKDAFQQVLKEGRFTTMEVTKDGRNDSK